MNPTFRTTSLPGVLICELKSFTDERGFFMETYQERHYSSGGIGVKFVQDNYSFSRQGVLRGLHFQLRRPQAKLVSVVHGAVFDVAVDIRRGSPTFGKWVGTILSSENRRQLFVPAEFAHGFCVLSETADVMYKCSDFYDPSDDRGVRWDDPLLAIEWPVVSPIISAKDRALPLIGEIGEGGLPGYSGS